MTDQLEEIKKGFVKNTLHELWSLREMLGEEENGSQDAAEKVFMVMHGICGTAPFVEFEHIAPMAQKIERVFDRIRKGEEEASEHIKVQTLRGIDFIISELQPHFKAL